MKKLPNLTGYSISPTGEVHSHLRPRILKPSNNNGYLMVYLKDDNGKSKWHYIHRLVCLAYNGEPERLKIWVNHIDGNKANNNHANLEWSTPSDNHIHAVATGLRTFQKGVKHWNYGKRYDQATKDKMSEAKKGENHPKFKGYYRTPFGVFASANLAAKETGLPAKTIINRCNNPHFIHLGYSFDSI